MNTEEEFAIISNSKIIKEAIKALGKSKKSISRKLEKMGIVGTPKDCRNCPIARYFEVCGITTASVDGTHVIDDNLIVYKLPKVVVDWIVKFDMKKLPGFIKREKKGKKKL